MFDIKHSFLNMFVVPFVEKSFLVFLSILKYFAVNEKKNKPKTVNI